MVSWCVPWCAESNAADPPQPLSPLLLAGSSEGSSIAVTEDSTALAQLFRAMRLRTHEPGLGLQKRTWTNDSELRRRFVCYPPRVDQKTAFKQAVASG